ncbi:hypothetical protein BST36_07360 [Mycolicibacterium moriokaense]|jgi:mycothiol synthase|uniref:Uncharacterized protein n=1 Tax=Mycolicibacterium moriokaense TaxID=39691 RepID=A0AAD1HDV5_9MYCO|nr:hypothetical protein [Mycolicibacterium moriokaense]MCV7038767.1 hypothetical protein [Mycolicibacterium moriokaense]ORB25368.1 hypothetical protein BST36_07360 [Mycolicibacterium moriokaense]BBX03622.1 hypothetical protein MMOR_45580 [Mycolicibacterium moriokaense]
MIKYEWRTQLDADEAAQLEDMLSRAAVYDAEPEYCTIDFADVQRSMAASDSRVKHLVIWMLPYSSAFGEADHPERIAGLMRLDVDDDGVADAAIVVDPRLRSIGITTLLLERVGLDTGAPDGWLGTGAHTITAWAQGNHPAAGRLSNRFLIPRTRRVWKLIRSTDSFEDATAAPVLEELSASTLDWIDSTSGELLGLREAGRVVGAVELDYDPVVSEEFARCATIAAASAPPTAQVQERRRLLCGAAATAHEAGFSGVIMYVDSDDTEWVNACRLAGFQHDRTDVRFQLGGQR